MRDLLIFAGLIVGAVAALFPSADTAPAEAEAAVEGVPPMAAREPTAVPTAAAPGVTELRRAGDGHFYAPITIGTRSITMLVDTGASVVALTGEDARAAGIHWSTGQLTVVAQGAGGPVRGVAVRIERMRLGSHEARDVPAVIVPEGLPVSLLGQTFLKHLEPMQIEKDRMLLGG